MIQCGCLECGKEFNRLRRRGSMVVCSPCSGNRRVREWKRANKDRAKAHKGYCGNPESKKRYGKSERGRLLGRVKASRWYWKDPNGARTKQRANYAKAPDRAIQRVVQRQTRIARATPPWADLDAIAAFYAEARRLTRETGVKYQVDHIYPLRAKDSCGLHIRANMQLLPAKLNGSKGNRIPDVCAVGVILGDAFATD